MGLGFWVLGLGLRVSVGFGLGLAFRLDVFSRARFCHKGECLRGQNYRHNWVVRTLNLYPSKPQREL